MSDQSRYQYKTILEIEEDIRKQRYEFERQRMADNIRWSRPPSTPSFGTIVARSVFAGLLTGLITFLFLVL